MINRKRLLNFLPNLTAVANCFVDTVLESSCTDMYTPVLRSASPRTLLTAAGLARSLLLFFLGWLIMSFPFFAYAVPARITSIQISDTTPSAQIIIKLSAISQPHIFTLTHPDRLVFDFSNTQLAIKLNSFHFVSSTIKNIRNGYPKPGVLRLVFDSRYPLYFKTSSQLPAQEIAVIFSTSEGVEKNKFILNKKLVPSSKNNSRSFSKTESPVMTVVIDPGHGGKDTGAIGNLGTQEKEIVLKISEQLANLINREPGMRAVLTRDGDYYVTLHNRLVHARKNKADIYISIHADSYFNNWASGASVYALSKNGATSIAARWLARRDNYSELGGVALSELNDQSPLLRSVLIDLAQTVTVTDSMRLGTALLAEIDNVAMLHYSRVEQAPFMVLKSPDIPSVLVETGFISNLKEELRLRDKAYQHKIAVSLFNGIRHYHEKCNRSREY